MFQTLSNKFSSIFDRLRSSGALTEEQIDGAMRDIRIALLEADVALVVVKDFIEKVRVKSIGRDIVQSITPSQMVIKIIHDELIALLSSPIEERAINLKAEPPVNIMMVGLQGSGKTTTTAKLALYLKNQGKKILMVSLDIYRPAAQEQLEILGQSAAIDSLAIIDGQKPLDITKRAMQE